MGKILCSLVFFFVVFFLSFEPASAEALRATPTKAQLKAKQAQQSEYEVAEEGDGLPATAAFQLSSKELLIVQEALNDAGHQCQENGIMGKKTWRALRRFQAERGLDVTGKIDKQTLKALGVYERIMEKGHQL